MILTDKIYQQIRDAVHDADWGCGCCMGSDPETQAADRVVDVLVAHGLVTRP